ncbi:MAG TPA: sigma-70 family RNA polymerase sigma factor [Pseudonocardiaceae bacterium]|jgi:RNA polymerase sigma factor (sigma-70 family)|nr:sigma-70 family RNA polymerase sigma factor [Pseudonocardiaceae bacterium]
MPEPTTAELVRRARADDQAAWAELVHRYGRVVWSVARAYGLSSTDAADVSQTSWLNLAQRLDTLRAPERLAGWLATTARHESLRVLAARRRETPLAWLDFYPVEDEHLPEHAVLAADTDGALWRTLAELPERCRTLLRLIAYAPELTYAQAASALGIQLGSVGNTRGRCLAELRRRLSGAGVLDGASR